MQQRPKVETQGLSQQDVIAALTSLSSLALQASALRLSPSETVEHFAASFLDQLVMLCGAQQGTLFFQPSQRGSVSGSPRERVVTSLHPTLIARTHMSVQEAMTAFNSALPIPEIASRPAELPVSLSWKRLPLVSATQALMGGSSPSLAPAQSSATIVLTWSDNDSRERKEAQQRALCLFPLIADLVDTILLHIATALLGRTETVEVFPAELLSTIGHEFRGPLTTIQGYATTLLHHDQRLSPDERQDFLRTINEASTHLGTLIERFLELALLETSGHSFAPEYVNMRALVQESITAAHRGQVHRLVLLSSPAGPFLFEKDVQAELPQDELTLVGDRRLLRTMVDILLENAMAYSTQESPIEVSLETTQTASALAKLQEPASAGTNQALILPAPFQQQEPLLALHVQDHGIGISPEHLALIFQRFYRVDTSLTREVNGLGLGLALCKAIVARHQGMLWVSSTLGEGSTFSLVLPRRLAHNTNGKTNEHAFDERMDASV
jgi:signal transduction histidine kinase